MTTRSGQICVQNWQILRVDSRKSNANRQRLLPKQSPSSERCKFSFLKHTDTHFRKIWGYRVLLEILLLNQSLSATEQYRHRKAVRARQEMLPLVNTTSNSPQISVKVSSKRCANCRPYLPNAIRNSVKQRHQSQGPIVNSNCLIEKSSKCMRIKVRLRSIVLTEESLKEENWNM